MVTNLAGDMVIDFFKSVPYPLLMASSLPPAHQLLPENWSDSRNYEDSETGPPSQKLQSIVPDYAGQWWPREGMTQRHHQAPAVAHGCAWSELWVTSHLAQGLLTLDANSNPQRQGRFCCWYLHSDPGHAQTQSWASGEKLQLAPVHREIHCDPHLWTASLQKQLCMEFFVVVLVSFFCFFFTNFIKACFQGRFLDEMY